jgi:hypothetical protein
MPFRHNAQLWTSDEVAKLLRWRSDGLSSSQIALRLGRSTKGVQSKAKELGLRYTPKPPQHYRQRERHEPVQRAGAVTLPPLPSLSDE